MRIALCVHTQSAPLSSSASHCRQLEVSRCRGRRPLIVGGALIDSHACSFTRSLNHLLACSIVYLSMCALLCVSNAAYAGPADPDREIPASLEKVTYRGLKITASSVARGFSTKNLKRMKAWRAWGTDPGDVEGAWIHFEWPRAHYLGVADSQLETKA